MDPTHNTQPLPLPLLALHWNLSRSILISFFLISSILFSHYSPNTNQILETSSLFIFHFYLSLYCNKLVSIFFAETNHENLTSFEFFHHFYVFLCFTFTLTLSCLSLNKSTPCNVEFKLINVYNYMLNL